MATRRWVICAVVVVGIVAACDRAPAPEAAPAANVAQPAATTPPADPARVTDAAPAEDANPFSFRGFHDVAFGSPAQALERWNIRGDAPAAAGACHELAESHGSEEEPVVTYMIEGDRFVRVDVEHPDIAAPGGGRLGSTINEIKAAYAGVVEQPHKYVEGGRILVVADPDGGQARLVFEADAAGVVTRWRIGVPPQVDYVEHCG